MVLSCRTSFPPPPAGSDRRGEPTHGYRQEIRTPGSGDLLVWVNPPAQSAPAGEAAQIERKACEARPVTPERCCGALSEVRSEREAEDRKPGLKTVPRNPQEGNMLDTPAMAMRIAATPVWLLWRGYLLLWWAFDDSPERAAARLSAKTTAAADVAPSAFVEGGEPGQGTSFEFVDSRKGSKRPLPPPMPRPDGLLKGAFAGSMVLCGLSSLAAAGLAAVDAMGPTRAGALWLWCCSIVLVGSVLGVRRIARKRWEKPKGPIARAKDATVHVAKAARDVAVDRAMAAIHFVRGEKNAVNNPPVAGSKHGPAAAAPNAGPNAAPSPAPDRIGARLARGVAAAAQKTSTRLVPAVARGARGVLDPLRDRASLGLAWAARKVAKHS
jgi:hypothetical protein